MRASMIALMLTLLPGSLLAQHGLTCGWSGDPASPPTTITQLRDRSRGAEAWWHNTDSLLMIWYRNCDDGAARRAIQDLAGLRHRRNSSDPLLLAWLAIAYARGPEIQIPTAVGATIRPAYGGSNAEREAVRLLERVAKATDWPEIAEELGLLALATRDSKTLEAASRVLWHRGRNGGSELLALLAEIELARGDLEAARHAAAYADSTHVLVMRVASLVELLAGTDTADAADMYLTALKRASEEEIEWFFDDIRLVLDPDELEEWSRLSSNRSGWIERKWQWRAQMAGVPVSVRLAVNAFRLNEATRRFRRLSYRGAPDRSALFWARDTMLTPIDDRGRIFMRHGQPDAEFRMRGPGATRVAWTYRAARASAMVFEFDKAPGSTLIGPVCGGGDLVDWASVLIGPSPGLAHYYYRCAVTRDTVPGEFARQRVMATRAATAALSSESGITVFAVPLTVYMNLYAFHGRIGSELAAYLSIMDPQSVGKRSVAYDVLYSVGDPVSETAVQMDTVIAYSGDALTPNATLHSALTLSVKPHPSARTTVTVSSRSADPAGQVSSTTWTVPARAAGMQLSDLVVAEIRNGMLRRGRFMLAPLPGHALAEDAVFRLYYELYDVELDDRLSVSLVIAPEKGKGVFDRLRALVSRRDAVELAFAERAAPDPDGVLRTERLIDANLNPGTYTLMVTVENGRSGQVASAETNLIVLKRDWSGRADAQAVVVHELTTNGAKTNGDGAPRQVEH